PGVPALTEPPAPGAITTSCNCTSAGPATTMPVPPSPPCDAGLTASNSLPPVPPRKLLPEVNTAPPDTTRAWPPSRPGWSVSSESLPPSPPRRSQSSSETCASSATCSASEPGEVTDCSVSSSMLRPSAPSNLQCVNVTAPERSTSTAGCGSVELVQSTVQESSTTEPSQSRMSSGIAAGEPGP